MNNCRNLNRTLAGLAFLLATLGGLTSPGAAQDVEIDHVLWGVPDLVQGAKEIANIVGVKPVFGGVHPGRGSANYLLAMGGSYLEVIGPDPEVTPPTVRGAELAALEEASVQTFAIRTSDIDELIARALAAGLGAGEPEPGSRATPSGGMLRWRAASFDSAEFGPFIPFAIEWSLGSPHPATTSPEGVEFVSLSVTHPDAAGLQRIYNAMGIPVDVSEGAPRMTLTIDTPHGRKLLTSDGVVE